MDLDHHQPQLLLPSSLVEICLKLVSRQLISILNKIQDSPEPQSYVGREKQLIRLIDFFRKPASGSPSAPVIPSVAPHLVQNLVRLYVHHFALDPLDYGPNDLPLLLLVAICAVYSDLDTCGFRTRDPSPDRRYCYHQLRLDRPIELELVQKYLQPSQCITILNLTGDTKFTDAGLVNLHHVMGNSLRSLILDHTSVTNLGIAHLSRPLSMAPDSSEQPNKLGEPQEAFRELMSISLRGLHRMTDASAKNLARFPNLLAIDLTGTSCTDATRLILNRSQNVDHKQSHFRPARSEEELEFFSAHTAEPSERLDKLMKRKQQSTSPANKPPPTARKSLMPSASLSTCNSLLSSSLPSIKRTRLDPSILQDLLPVRKSLKKY
ncbi:hypothetical protein VP01_675g12 [Puccinia sorghi]|uniref:Uncharacterized protein n=1 Tax=Puccinia sorghi TaxID=27349 RepID=A0A0L6UEN7_9BASI|nr:hypothetical protein VP01_675g12 [Puccinia sorghi]